MNKLILFGIVLLVFFSFTNSVKASPWGLPRCGTGLLDFIPGLCCEDECSTEQRACDISGNYLIKCGDYDFDQCYELPPYTGCKTDWLGITTCHGDFCSFGCINSVCWQADPNEMADCKPGQTRCGGYNGEFLIECVFDEGVGKWIWGVDSIEHCRFGCGGDQCLSDDQRQASECSFRQVKCSGNNIVHCEDTDMDGVWNWQGDPGDWYSCQYGCKDGKCLDQEGDAPDIECITGQTRCDPSHPDYIQFCVDNKWEYDLSRQTYCTFGCHLGFCNMNPDPDLPCEDTCQIGDTRCGADGSYLIQCEYDSVLGCNVWGSRSQCISGRCENGVCAERTQSGYIVDISEINETIHGLTHDDRYIYVFGREWEDRFINYSIYRLSYNLTVLSKFNISGYEDIEYKDLAYDGNNLWGARRVNDSHFQLTQFDSLGNVINNYYVFVNTTGGYGGNVEFGGIAIDNTYIYLGSNSNSVNANRSIVMFYRANLTDSGQTICTIGSPNFPDSDCQYYQLFGSLLHYNGKIYIFKHNFISGNMFLSSSWENTGIEVYGIDGYYYGFFNVTTTPNAGNNDYEGIDFIEDKFYFLYPNRQDPENSLLPTPRIEIKYSFTTCDNECYNESSKCSGALKNYIIPCVQDADGCFKWYGGDPTCGIFGTCETTLCKLGCYERWENHHIINAFCNSDINCKDTCEPGEISCDDTGKYVRHCVYDYAYVTGPGNIIPVLTQCWSWDKSSNWTDCGYGECLNGRCVQSSKCTVNETKCFVYTNLTTETEIALIEINPNLIGTEHVMTCKDTNNDGYYEWDIKNMSFCYWGCNETIVNATTDQSIATCINASGDYLNIKNTIYESSVWMEIMFSDPISKYMLTIIICMIIFLLFSVYGQWELGLFGVGIVIIMTSLIGWMPFEIIIIGIVFSGIFVYNRISEVA